MPTDDHLVSWLTRETSGDFLLEFHVRPQNRKRGLNLVFLNARARKEGFRERGTVTGRVALADGASLAGAWALLALTDPAMPAGIEFGQ